MLSDPELGAADPLAFQHGAVRMLDISDGTNKACCLLMLSAVSFKDQITLN